MVTRRIKPMQVGGKTIYQIGFPIHWGFLGRGQQRGSLANLVTPTVVDPNSFAPEYKGFLVKLEKVVTSMASALEIVRISASTPPAPGVRDARRTVVEARRHLDLHRLQGVRGGLPGVERPAAGADGADGHLPDAARH